MRIIISVVNNMTHVLNGINKNMIIDFLIALDFKLKVKEIKRAFKT